ncbi:MAG: hypothetical protein ABGZ17_25110, partial [Planctomycetaceae bacterium]
LFAFLSGLTSLGLIETGSTMGAPLFAVGFQWSVLVSMMLHARYVVYECCDPPRLRVRATSHRRWGRWLRSRPSAQELVDHPLSQKVVEVSSISEPYGTGSLPATESVAEPEAPLEKPSRTKRKKRAAQRPLIKPRIAQTDTVDAAGVAVDGPENSEPTHRESTVSDSDTESLCAESAEAKPAHVQEVRIDCPIPPDELKGLTKRQRRAVRKQRRETQREQNTR